MKILLTGSKGQVGWEVTRRAQAFGFPVAGYDLPEMDITRSGNVSRIMDEVCPDLVINAAAYTQVDRAESEREIAFLVNRTGPGNLAEACHRAGIPLIHISTDYVFDGKGRTPYRETDTVSPLGVYGRSKAEGDKAVREILPAHLILRTSWVYGVHGGNFVKTMLRLGRERSLLRVVADQSGCPTFAGDIAHTLLTLAERIRGGTTSWGAYHYCGKGVTTWHRFAEEIFRTARKFGYPASPEVEAITTAEYPTPVTRPAYSALDTSRIGEVFGISPRPWEESLSEMLKELMAGE